MPNFEEFLQEVHAVGYVGLDDDMPDAFDEWLGALDHDDFMRLGDKYGAYIHEWYAKELEKIKQSIGR